MAASRYDAVRDDSESSTSSSELFEVWRENDVRSLGRKTLAIHSDVRSISTKASTRCVVKNIAS